MMFPAKTTYKISLCDFAQVDYLQVYSCLSLFPEVYTGQLTPPPPAKKTTTTTTKTTNKQTNELKGTTMDTKDI